ncbi:MAG: hypothetical protein ACK51N_04580, partial [bacterium]
FEDSTRTRVSFSVAARRLGAEVIDLTSAGSSVSKGETVIDTAANVAAMGVDAVVIRHRSSGAPHMVVRALEQLHDAYSRTPERAPAFVGAGGGNKPAPISSNAIASIREYAEFYALDAQRAARLKPGAIIMHPGPINRGVEITSDVADGERSVVLRQVSHGVAVRMAVLALCMGAVG